MLLSDGPSCRSARCLSRRRPPAWRRLQMPPQARLRPGVDGPNGPPPSASLEKWRERDGLPFGPLGLAHVCSVGHSEDVLVADEACSVEDPRRACGPLLFVEVEDFQWAEMLGPGFASVPARSRAPAAGGSNARTARSPTPCPVRNRPSTRTARTPSSAVLPRTRRQPGRQIREADRAASRALACSGVAASLTSPNRASCLTPGDVDAPLPVRKSM